MTCIVVLGAHRSGTSLAAGILHQAGVNMGRRFREPDEWNPTGYWGDLDWLDLNKRMLRDVGGNWYTPPGIEALKAQGEALTDEIRALVALKDKAPLWGFKDPRTCLTIGSILPHLPTDTRFLMVRRELDEIITSLMRRAQGRGYYETPEHWRALTDEYYQRLNGFADSHMGYTLRVNYDHLVNLSRQSSVARWLGWLCGLNSFCVEQAMERMVRWEKTTGQP